MDFDLEIDSKYKIIKVKASCLLNQELRKEILSAIAGHLKINNFSRVIIDLTESTFNPAEPMIGALDLTNYMRIIGIQSHVKLAFIYAEAENHRQYFENVAQLEGFNIRYFKSNKEALAWLQ
ncbi:MAG: hypothetical protein KQH63_13500 [Desulfobulbaceae bacterium]|nr:hypothetical protein [Desulfobulbaceae bacterium]